MFLVFSVVLLVISICVFSSATNVIKKYQHAEWQLELVQHERSCPNIPVYFVSSLDGFKDDSFEVSITFLQFITAWSIARSLNTKRVLYIPDFFTKRLSTTFSNRNILSKENISDDCLTTNEVSWDKYDFLPEDMTDYKTLIKKLNKGSGNIQLNKPQIFYSPIADHINEIKTQFRYQESMEIMITRIINRYKDTFYTNYPNYTGKITFVGVRAKRKTEGKTEGKTLAKPEYFLEAMDEFRARSKELGKPIFFILSDEPSWADFNLLRNKGDEFVVVIFLAKNLYDISFLSYCNHTIIDSIDEVGVLGSLLGQGTVTSTDSNKAVFEGLSKLPNWRFKKV